MYGVYSQQSGGGPSVPEVLIIGGSNSRIFRSTDDGLTFTTQIVYHPSQPSTPLPWGRVFFCNGKFFISAGTVGSMVSHDFGLTWVTVRNEGIYSIVWNGTYYFACFNYQIRRSADLVTWTNLSSNGVAFQNGDDLCVVGNDVYWSTNRNIESSPRSFLGIRKCVAPYNMANVTSINVPGSVPHGTIGLLHKTSNGLILTARINNTSQQRIYSTSDYITLTAANSSYISTVNSVKFDIVVGDYAYILSAVIPFGGYGSPVINTLSSTTAPNNSRALYVDTDGTTFVTKVPGTQTLIWTRAVTANSTAFSSTDVGFNATSVFYTGKSFLVMNGTNLRRSETGTSGWSTAINPFSGNFNGGTISLASSYKI